MSKKKSSLMYVFMCMCLYVCVNREKFLRTFNFLLFAYGRSVDNKSLLSTRKTVWLIQYNNGQRNKMNQTNNKVVIKVSWLKIYTS